MEEFGLLTSLASNMSELSEPKEGSDCCSEFSSQTQDSRMLYRLAFLDTETGVPRAVTEIEAQTIVSGLTEAGLDRALPKVTPPGPSSPTSPIAKQPFWTTGSSKAGGPCHHCGTHGKSFRHCCCACWVFRLAGYPVGAADCWRAGSFPRLNPCKSVPATCMG